MKQANELDKFDHFTGFRDRFEIPDRIIYLDGNSLGLLPRTVSARIRNVTEQEWGEGLIRSWNQAGWMNLPMKVGDKLAPLVGVGPGQIAVGDSTSVNLFKALSAALSLRPDRRVIMIEDDNFPTDTYIAEGLANLADYELRRASPEVLAKMDIGQDVAVLLLSHVHYRSAEIRDMHAINAAAHGAGALVLWDLSHSTGALPVDLAGTGCDLAVGCTYKYLNGGPGAPAFIWVNPDLVDRASQPLSGWMGHASPFAFSDSYAPSAGIRRFMSGTPQVLNLSALDEALNLWADVDMTLLRRKSMKMTEFFIEGVERNCAGFGLQLASPRDPAIRGSHVVFDHPKGYEIVQALIARGIIGDFRAPQTMRFGFAPLYLSFVEVAASIETLKDILEHRIYEQPEFAIRNTVT